MCRCCGIELPFSRRNLILIHEFAIDLHISLFTCSASAGQCLITVVVVVVVVVVLVVLVLVGTKLNYLRRLWCS